MKKNMGNIDDPTSEAYKRFGAGRGKAETAKTKASTIDQIGERERREEAYCRPVEKSGCSSLKDKKPAKTAKTSDRYQRATQGIWL
jgi:hypothetical protein